MPYNKECTRCNTKFQTKDNRQKHCCKICYFEYLKNNPNFKNKTHTTESIHKMISNMPDMTGAKNPFYGKKHTPESIQLIKLKQLKWRLNNQSTIEEKQLKNLGLTVEKILLMFNEFESTKQTLASLGAKYKIDRRTLKSYFIKYACSKKQYEELAWAKKHRAYNNITEEKMHLVLAAAFGTENVIRQKRFGKYTFDFCLFDKLLIEYDGFYWHNFYKNNDVLKTKIAQDNGYRLYRVLEPESRQTDFIKEIENIKEILNEIQTHTN